MSIAGQVALSTPRSLHLTLVVTTHRAEEYLRFLALLTFALKYGTVRHAVGLQFSHLHGRRVACPCGKETSLTDRGDVYRDKQPQE
ncbi:hypothetical protein [Streptomyces sp. NPDC004675]|uniref:hypothetical protein n=1 Tax=Streptomyces sp. NPDC004675 TaxID=3154286 RepID=UPI0033A98142